MAKRKTPVKLVSYEEIMGIGDYEEVVTIAIDDIHPFKNHPFKVRDDEKKEELITELLDRVDEKKLGFTIAVEISYIDQEIQKWLYEYIKENGVVKPEQIAGLRKYLEQTTVNQMQMIQVLNANLKGRIPSKKVTLSEKKLHKYFPADYSASEMEGVIIALLQEWKQRQAGE